MVVVTEVIHEKTPPESEHDTENQPPFGNFFRSLTFKTRLVLDQDKWEYSEEPHVSRRQAMLAAHPEIKQLMGPDPRIALLVSLVLAVQMSATCLISIYQPNWLVWLLATYFISGTLNHTLATAIHEIGHNLAFGHKYGNANRVLSIITNLPLAIPAAISYRKYHHEHHRWLGHDTLDVDVPLNIEVVLFQTTPMRIVWVLINSLFYAVRPFFKSPQPLTLWEVINMTAQLVFDWVVWRYLGASAFLYLLVGTILGFGPHPMAGHVISEHYLFADNQATHSYYGPLNPLLFNLGYHVEHHDFPYIPFTRLPKLREIAPEFYDHLPYHTSLCKVIWDFIFMPNVGPGGRSITSTNVSKGELYEKMPHFDLTSSLTYPESKNGVSDKKTS